jgi:hypothetical protein
MAGGGALCATAWLITRRGWRWMPAAMTLGGLWAILPDTPRLFRYRFRGIPGLAGYADGATEQWMHQIGDLFFFHRALDRQPHEYALHGLFGIVALYAAAAIFTYIMYERRLRRSPRRSAPRPPVPVHPAPRPSRTAEQGVLARIGKPPSEAG